jgi:hypothetical protein
MHTPWIIAYHGCNLAHPCGISRVPPRAQHSIEKHVSTCAMDARSRSGACAPAPVSLLPASSMSQGDALRQAGIPGKRLGTVIAETCSSHLEQAAHRLDSGLTFKK